MGRELTIEGTLYEQWGSRSLPWRIFLGLLQDCPHSDADAEEPTRVSWVKATKQHRKKWQELEQSLSLKAIIAKNKVFNPLAPPSTKTDTKATEEREMRDLIKTDVRRTLQEYDYFHQQSIKDLMAQILFLWGRENPDYGYKQGMNEILAIILIVFDSERVQSRDEQQSLDHWDNLSDEEIAKDHLTEFLFDPCHLKGDLYACFDRVLQIGVKHLYMDTKDITDLKNERSKRDTDEEKKRR
jgi:hypothetical protein